MLTLSEERKFHLIFAQGSESSRERKYQGVKVRNFRLLLGAKVRGNESSSYHRRLRVKSGCTYLWEGVLWGMHNAEWGMLKFVFYGLL